MWAHMIQQMPTELRSVSAINPGHAYHINLMNDSTVYIVTNSYVPFSNDWQGVLRTLTDRRLLSQFDAMIVGNVNSCSPATPTKSGSLDKFLENGITGLSCNNTKPLPQQWIEAYGIADDSRRRMLFFSSFMRRMRKWDMNGPKR